MNGSDEAKQQAIRSLHTLLTVPYWRIDRRGRELYRDHPEVLIDYTFELWGEKHLIDSSLLASADLDWLSDIEDRDKDAAGSLQARTLLY